MTAAPTLAGEARASYQRGGTFEPGSGYHIGGAWRWTARPLMNAVRRLTGPHGGVIAGEEDNGEIAAGVIHVLERQEIHNRARVIRQDFSRDEAAINLRHEIAWRWLVFGVTWHISSHSPPCVRAMASLIMLALVGYR